MVNKQSAREARHEEEKRRIAESRKQELAKMPMNQYMGKGTELGQKLGRFRLSDYEFVVDVMRKIKIFYVMLRDSKQHTIELKSQILISEENNNLYTLLTDDKGKPLSVGKAKVQVLEEDARIQGCLADIRKQIIDKLMPLINTDEFTDKHFEEYVKHIEIKLGEQGYELFPSEYQIIPLE